MEKENLRKYSISKILNNKYVYVHNGKDYMQIRVSPSRYGHKLGEFSITKILGNEYKSAKKKKK